MKWKGIGPQAKRLQRLKEQIEEAMAELGDAEDEIEAEREADQLEDVLGQLRQEIASRRGETGKDNAMNKQEEAARVRKSAEDLFERLVDDIMEREGCDRHRAYFLATTHPLGKSIMQNHDDAYEIQTGGITSIEISKIAH